MKHVSNDVRHEQLHTSISPKVLYETQLALHVLVSEVDASDGMYLQLSLKIIELNWPGHPNEWNC